MINKRLFLCLVALFCMVSCKTVKLDQKETPFAGIYRPTAIQMQGPLSIKPVCEFDASFDQESRTYYQNADTSLIFIREAERVRPEWVDVYAMDWRIVEMKVVALDDQWDGHPAGSLLNDILKVRYWYKWQMITSPLPDGKNHTIMLTDYFPYDEVRSELFFVAPDDMATPGDAQVEVTLVDAFGRTLSAQWTGFHPN